MTCELMVWNQAVDLYKWGQSPYETMQYEDLCFYLNRWGWASPLAVAWGG